MMLDPHVEQMLADLDDDDWHALVTRVRPPGTSQVTPPGELPARGQITSRAQLKGMTPKQIVEAREQGQLNELMGR